MHMLHLMNLVFYIIVICALVVASTGANAATEEEIAKYRKIWNPFSAGPQLVSSADLQPKGQFFLRPYVYSEIGYGQFGREAAVGISEVLSNFEQEREAGSFEKLQEDLPDKVRVMTMHSAKGLEAGVVFAPALEDDLMPGLVSNLEERRRLFYVSVTRAKQMLLLSWASQRTGKEIHRAGGRMLGKEPSRFLKEMGA